MSFALAAGATAAHATTSSSSALVVNGNRRSGVAASRGGLSQGGSGFGGDARAFMAPRRAVAQKPVSRDVKVRARERERERERVTHRDPTPL
jgi:hypothetical protein